MKGCSTGSDPVMGCVWWTRGKPSYIPAGVKIAIYFNLFPLSLPPLLSRSEWRGFHPYNNVLWLNYLATKVSIKAKLKGISSKSWKRRLEPFIKKIKQNSSAKEVFFNVFSPDAVRRINATIKW